MKLAPVPWWISERLIEQYFHVVLFIMFYKVILTYFKSVDETLVCDHSKRAMEQYFHVVLFIMLYKVVLTFTSAVDETLVCDHSNERYWAVFSCGTVYYAAQER